jgi:hypothetical protein
MVVCEEGAREDVSFEQFDRRVRGLPDKQEAGKKKDSSTLAVLVFLVLAVGGGLLYFFVIQPRLDKHRFINQHGKPRDSVIQDGVVLVLDDVDITDTLKRDDHTPEEEWTRAKLRVTVLDPASGKQLLQTLVESCDVCRCQPAAPGKLWCDIEGLALYETKTFKKLTTLEDAVTKAGVGKPMPKLWQIEGAIAAQLLSDGRVARLDANTLAVTRSDDVPPKLRKDPSMLKDPQKGTIEMLGDTACKSAILSAKAQLGAGPGVTAADFAPGAKKKPTPAGPASWTVRSNGQRATIVKGTTTSADSYLQPGLLGAFDPPVVLHHSSVDTKADAVRLSRLRADGTNAWTVDLKAPDCEHAAVVGGILVVTTTGTDRRAVGIDPESGAVRWEVGF